jgi:hypothetical protein
MRREAHERERAECERVRSESEREKRTAAKVSKRGSAGRQSVAVEEQLERERS